MNIIQSAPGGTRYSIAVRFASSENAQAWQHSDTRKALIHDVSAMLARDSTLLCQGASVTGSQLTRLPH